MNPPADLNRLAQMLDQYCASLQAIEERTDNLAAQRQLQILRTQLQEGKAKFLAEYQKARDRAEQRLAAARQKAEQVKQQLAEAREKLANPPPPAPPPTPPQPVVDPALGRQLAAELLRWHGSGRLQEMQPISGEIWQALQGWQES